MEIIHSNNSFNNKCIIDSNMIQYGVGFKFEYKVEKQH